MATVFAFINYKGGVGKSTSTINLGIALGEQGKKVLLIDADPQANLTLGLRYDSDELTRSLYDVIVNPSVALSSVVLHPRKTIDLVPASYALKGAAAHVGEEPGREHKLRLKLRPVQNQYDYVLIDCRPDLDFLTSNAVAAADYVIVPFDCQFFSLKGITEILRFIKAAQSISNPNLKLFGFLANKYDNTNHANQALEVMKKNYGDQLLDVLIRRRVAVADAQVEGKSVLETEPSSDIAQEYRKLAQEVITRG